MIKIQPIIKQWLYVASILLFFWGVYLSLFVFVDYLYASNYSKEGKTLEMIVIRKYSNSINLVIYNADSTISNEQEIYVNHIVKAKLKLFQKVRVVEMINKSNEIKYYLKMSFEDENVALLERPWTVRVIILISILLPFLIKFGFTAISKEESKQNQKEKSEEKPKNTQNKIPQLNK